MSVRFMFVNINCKVSPAAASATHHLAAVPNSARVEIIGTNFTDERKRQFHLTFVAWL